MFRRTLSTLAPTLTRCRVGTCNSQPQWYGVQTLLNNSATEAGSLATGTSSSQCGMLLSGAGQRSFASSADTSKQVDEVNELFTVARDEIEYAKEEAETVYFNDAVKEAKAAVDACLQKWSALLAGLPDEEKTRLMRSMGLKIEQLKAEFEQVNNLHLED